MRHLILTCFLLLFSLYSGSSTAAEIKGVQSGTATSNGNGTITVNIPSAVDMEKAFLMFQTRSNSARPPGSTVRGRIASSTSLEFARTTNESSTINIQWYVVEFESGVRVQRGSTAQSSTNVNVALPNSVDSLSQAYVTWSKTPRNSDSIWSQDDPIYGRLTNTSNIRFTSRNGNSSHTIWWQVIEYTNPNDINVQTGSTTSMQGGTSTVSQNISAVDIGQSFILSGFTTSGSGNDVGERMISAYFKSSTEIEFRRSQTGDDIEEIHWQVIELKDGATVQGAETIIDGSSKDISITTVDTSKSVPFASVQAFSGQNMGRTDYNSNDITGVASVTLSLTTSNQLTLERNNNNDDSHIGWFIVDYSASETIDPPASTCGAIPVTHAAFAAASIDISGAASNNGSNMSNGTYSGNAALDIGAITPITGVAYALPDTDPITIPSNSSSTDVTMSNGQVINATSDVYYDEVKIQNGRTGYLTGAGPFHIKTLKVEHSNTVLNVDAGIYYINEVDFKNRASLNINSGPVIFYISDEFKIKDRFNITGGSITDFRVYMLDGSNDAKFEGSSNFTGMVYAPYGATITAEDSATLNASLITSGDIEFKNNAQLTFSNADSAAVTAVSTCQDEIVQLPSIYHAMDEDFWDGSAEEVEDSSGNDHHGVAVNGSNTSQSSPAIDGAIGTCGYGQFDGVDHYIEQSSLYDILKSTASLSFWMRTTQVGNNTVWQAPGITGVEEDRGADDIFWGWIDASGHLGLTAKSDGTDVKSTTRINDGNFHHIVLTRNATSGLLQIFVNGVLEDSGTMPAGDIGNSFSRIGSITNTNNSFTYFNGDIDEFRVFSSVLTPNQALTEMNRIHTCSVSNIASFNIVPASTEASTCLNNVITITAIDNNGDIMTDYQGLLNLSTTTNTGNWSVNSATNELTPANDNDDNGAVSYLFSSSDNGVIELNLDNTHAGPLTINGVDSVTASSSSNSPEITFSENVFIIEVNDSIDSSLTETPIIARNHQMQVSMVTDDSANSGSCGINTLYTGEKNLKTWLTLDTEDVGGSPPNFNGDSAPNMVTSLPASDNTSLIFNDGTADFFINADDVGKFRINIMDDTGLFTSTNIAGDYGPLTTIPFGLAITEIKTDTTNNPESSTDLISSPNTGIFTSAGSEFSLVISAVGWESSDDTDNNGLLDNGEYRDNTLIVNSFAWETTLERLSSGFTPATGTVGNLYQNNIAYSGIIDSSDYSSGQETVENLQYSEVGSFTIQANSLNFLNSNIDLKSDDIIVGRFTPDSFEINITDNGTLNNTISSAFTYIGQTFGYDSAPTFTITAKNGLSPAATTTNYTGNYANITANSWMIDSAEETNQQGANEIDIMQLTYTQGAANCSGNAGVFDCNFGADTFSYDKDGNSQVAPFNAQIELTINTVSDGEVTSNNLDAKFNPNGNSLRFARVNIENAHGSELVPLNVPLTLEYFNGTSFQTNTDDSTTIITEDMLTLTPDLDFTDAAISSLPTIANNPLEFGDADLSLCPPGTTPCTPNSGNTGFITIDVDLTTLPYLRFDWDNNGDHDNDPSARATFGIFNGNTKHIYFREIY